MNYVHLAIGAFVIYTALMKRELLIQKKSFNIILLASILLFIVGLIDVTFYFTRGVRYFISGALFCPLITLAQYRLSRRVFLKYVKREPRDTVFIWVGEDDLWKDRLFNVLYFPPAFMIVIIIMGGVERLSTIGWRPAGLH
jgi:hypothetical protein